MNKRNSKPKPAPPNPLTLETPTNFQTYKAYGKFSPIYDAAKDRIWDCYGYDEAQETLGVLEALARHANQYGVMYKLGYRTLKQHSHLGYPRVRAGMLRIVYELGYLREHRIVIPTRTNDMVDWQISPRVMWIAQPSIEHAESLWASAKTPAVSAMETQPESETDPENRPSNQKLTRSTTRNSPQGKGRFQETPIEMCQAPINTSRAENLAQTIVKTMLTHESQARQMVLTYGEDRVSEVMTEVRKQMSRRLIQRPAGLLVQLLRTKYGKRTTEAELEALAGQDSQEIPEFANSWGLDLSEVYKK